MMASAQTWSAAENSTLFRSIVSTVLQHRNEIYGTPGLEPWSGNGGSRINDKIQQMLKKYGNNVPDAAEIAKEEVAKLKDKKGGTPTKRNSAGSPKKRKIKEEEEEDDEA